MTVLDLLRRNYSMLEIEAYYLKKEIEDQKDSSEPCGDISLLGIQYSMLLAYTGLILERIKYHEKLEEKKLEELEASKASEAPEVPEAPEAPEDAPKQRRR